MKVSVQFHDPYALLLMYILRYPLRREMDGPQSRYGRFGRGKNTSSFSGSESQFVGRPYTIIIIVIISFTQFIYTNIPETKYVPREYSVAAILLLLFMVLISLVTVLNLLHFYIGTFRSDRAVPNMAVFCSSLNICFPSMLLTYFLNDFEIVPVAPIITGITFVFTFNMRCISIVRYLYFRICRLFFLKSHFCILKLQRLLTYTFPFYYHGL